MPEGADRDRLGALHADAARSTHVKVDRSQRNLAPSQSRLEPPDRAKHMRRYDQCACKHEEQRTVSPTQQHGKERYGKDGCPGTPMLQIDSDTRITGSGSGLYVH